MADHRKQFIVALSTGFEFHLTLFLLNMFKADPQMFRRDEPIDPFGPFDEEGPLGEHRVQVQLFSFGRGVEAIGVHVKKQALIRAPIDVDKDKGRAGDGILRTPALRNTLHEGRFARAQFALQADHITRLQCPAQTPADAARLFGAAAEKIQRV